MISVKNDSIMSISRLRMATDGKGVSTLVAFYDCPLKCKYCINKRCHRDDFDRERSGEYELEQLLDVLRQDEIYYMMTGGGVVFGGGEPLLQSSFIHKVCRLTGNKYAKRIETSLNVPWEYVEPLLNDIDEWIIDIKETNPEIYEKYTGVDYNNVMNNLLLLVDAVPLERIHIRIPYIPGYNTPADVEKSVQWVRTYIGVEPEIFEYRIE